MTVFVWLKMDDIIWSFWLPFCSGWCQEKKDGECKSLKVNNGPFFDTKLGWDIDRFPFLWWANLKFQVFFFIRLKTDKVFLNRFKDEGIECILSSHSFDQRKNLNLDREASWKNDICLKFVKRRKESTFASSPLVFLFPGFFFFVSGTKMK